MMPNLEEAAYSRQQTIAAVSDFYEFLKTLYLNDSEVIYPPAEGWPSIANADPTILEFFGKSDEVLALIAHLPYIRLRSDWDDGPQSIPNCQFADWQYMINTITEPHDHVLRRTEDDFSELALAHVIGLTIGGHETIPVIVIDTQLGVVLWEGSTLPGFLRQETNVIPYDYPDSDEDVPEEEAGLRGDAGTWTIPDFFEMLKRQFTELRWIPVSHYTLWSEDFKELPGGKEEGMTSMLQSIYRQHGWPDDLDRYQKEKCLEAVMEALRECYPDSQYSSDYREEQAE